MLGLDVEVIWDRIRYPKNGWLQVIIIKDYMI